MLLTSALFSWGVLPSNFCPSARNPFHFLLIIVHESFTLSLTYFIHKIFGRFNYIHYAGWQGSCRGRKVDNTDAEAHGAGLASQQKLWISRFDIKCIYGCLNFIFDKDLKMKNCIINNLIQRKADCHVLSVLSHCKKSILICLCFKIISFERIL